MCVLYLEPPFWLSQAWEACTFCSTIFCQCTRAPPVQTLLFLPLTMYESLKCWHPGSWFKWFKALRTENWIPSGEYFATSSNHSNLHFLGLCWRLLKSGTLVVLGIIFSTAFFVFFFPLICLVWFSVAFFETWRFCWTLALQGWDPAGTREQCISSWASSGSQDA